MENNTEKDQFSKAVVINRFKTCKACRGRLVYLYSGIYQCETCKVYEMDEFGKIKNFLDQNGPTPAIFIAEKTGVTLDVINDFLRKGRVEIPEGAPFYIKCEKCGTDIRYGRYCPECAAHLAGSIKQAFLAEDVGERPKQKGKMHFLDKNR